MRGLRSAGGRMADEAVPVCAASRPGPEQACRPRRGLWPWRFRREAAGARAYNDSADSGYRAGICMACAPVRIEADARHRPVVTRDRLRG